MCSETTSNGQSVARNENASLYYGTMNDLFQSPDRFSDRDDTPTPAVHPDQGYAFPEHFHPLACDWFRATWPDSTPIQKAAWAQIDAGYPTLISAPTGSGKTLAAFFSSINRLLVDALDAPLQGTRVLYISPLKALSNDIEKNLQQPLRGIADLASEKGVTLEPITVAVRTGDTPQSARQKMVRQPPNILVTTPESLYILLTSESGRRMLSSVRDVIVDEIHAMAGAKRGAHLLLSLARLDALRQSAGQVVPRRIGLSATQKPIENMARFLCHQGECRIVDDGHRRPMDLALCLPDSSLSAVMSNEVWTELYDQLASWVGNHRTTLIFVNTRRLAERLTRHLEERLGEDAVMAHHGSLALAQRHRAEQRLKAGDLKALVATASLELGIDVGDVDLVCQMGSPRGIAVLLQRVGRSGHAVGRTPKGRLFPLSLDDLVECVALLEALKDGQLDRIELPAQPVDVLCQQIVAEVACRDWTEDDLYALMTANSVYQNLSREVFAVLCQMLADGYATQRGRHGAYLHRDVVQGGLRARRGARLTALMNAGVIPDQFDYDVLLRPQDMRIGSVNEDFAFESVPGDIFQLGNHSYRIQKVETGRVFVEDAAGLPPNLPFWFGEAPGRSDELSVAVSDFRQRLANLFETAPQDVAPWLTGPIGLSAAAATQLIEYLKASWLALGSLPHHQHLVLERFFDETGDMHLVIHSTYGSRINRALGLSLRKKFCRRFNFELQASALEDSLVLSLGPTHSFDLSEVLGWLKRETARETLIQALLDAPMFEARWRWAATNALAIKRMMSGKRRPPQFQRSDAEDLIAVCFPDQLACQENLSGQREVPDHPLVVQAINDCLTDIMDIEGLESLLGALESGAVKVSHCDLVHPSPLADAIINARPYAFLDDGAAEERRTNNVSSHRSLSLDQAATLGTLDPEAIARVRQQSWPLLRDADEVHDALLVCGVLTADELGASQDALETLKAAGRAVDIHPDGAALWVARERVHLAVSIWPQFSTLRTLCLSEPVDAAAALVELLRSRMEVCGPIDEAELTQLFRVEASRIAQAMIALEVEGCVLRGNFDSSDPQWCHRRLLHRIHRLSRQGKRQRFSVVDAACFQRFLGHWQGLFEPRAGTRENCRAVLDQLEGVAVPVSAWLNELLPARMSSLMPDELDQLCRSGEITWCRLNHGQATQLAVNTPIALLPRRSQDVWWLHQQGDSGQPDEYAGGTTNLRVPPPDLSDMDASSSARAVFECLSREGALFVDEIISELHLLPTQFESAISELVAQGLVTSDSFSGARFLISNEKIKRRKARYRKLGYGGDPLQDSGRWSLVRPRASLDYWKTVEHIARALLRRYGVLFHALQQKLPGLPPWRDLVYVLRLMEARDELAGGRFVDGFSGEQFALPEVPALLQGMQRKASDQSWLLIAASDPLNCSGLLSDVPRIPAISGNRLLIHDGVIMASLAGGEISLHEPVADESLIRGLLISHPPGLIQFRKGMHHTGQSLQ